LAARQGQLSPSHCPYVFTGAAKDDLNGVEYWA
jgi:hypothetical protein